MATVLGSSKLSALEVTGPVALGLGGNCFTAVPRFVQQVSMADVDLFQPGQNYFAASRIPTTGGSGTGMTVNIGAVAGVFINESSFTVNWDGFGYKENDVITINQGTLNGAEFRLLATPPTVQTTPLFIPGSSLGATSDGIPYPIVSLGYHASAPQNKKFPYSKNDSNGTYLYVTGDMRNEKASSYSHGEKKNVMGGSVWLTNTLNGVLVPNFWTNDKLTETSNDNIQDVIGSLLYNIGDFSFSQRLILPLSSGGLISINPTGPKPSGVLGFAPWTLMNNGGTDFTQPQGSPNGPVYEWGIESALSMLSRPVEFYIPSVITGGSPVVDYYILLPDPTSSPGGPTGGAVIPTNLPARNFQKAIELLMGQASRPLPNGEKATPLAWGDIVSFDLNISNYLKETGATGQAFNLYIVGYNGVEPQIASTTNAGSQDFIAGQQSGQRGVMRSPQGSNNVYGGPFRLTFRFSVFIGDMQAVTVQQGGPQFAFQLIQVSEFS